MQGARPWGDADRETQLFDLAVPGGVVSTTGIAGLTLHGGVGHLRRKPFSAMICPPEEDLDGGSRVRSTAPFRTSVARTRDGERGRGRQGAPARATRAGASAGVIYLTAMTLTVRMSGAVASRSGATWPSAAGIWPPR